MSNVVIKAENLSKQYRLGEVGTGTIQHDLKRWWYNVRGKEDPFLKVGETNDRTQKGESEFVWALKDINFEIEQGDVVGIIGRNGAGKSTLLKILSKTTLPTTGSIKAKGRIASLLEVGTGFHPELTGRDNIFLNGAILGMTKKEIKRKFDEIVNFAGVERYIDTPVKRYSSGMYVRLAFGVAAHLESEILIVDEVLAVGDAEFQKKAIGKMQDVSTGQGRTVLFVSHNMAAVRALCKTGILIHNGKVSKQDNINEIVQMYNDLFLGDNEMIFQSRFPLDPSKTAEFIEVKLLDQKDNLNKQKAIDVFTPLKLQISFIVRKKITGSTPIIWLKKDGLDLCWSFLSDGNDGILSEGMAPGEYTYEVNLPTPLKKGVYTCNLIIGKLRVGDYHRVDDVIRFEVDDLSFDPTNKSYTGSRPGIIPAMLTWKMK